MDNNLYNVEKNLRSIAKRCKTVKYSLGLVILFLMLGGGALSEEINNESIQNTIPTKKQISSSKENLKKSVSNFQTKIGQAKFENERSLRGLELELIQLMEQGEQVVKSPWSSWQFGMNYMYNNWRGIYKGIGDKEEKYWYNAAFVRPNWKLKNALDGDSEGNPIGDPITPGDEPTDSWKTASGTGSGAVVPENKARWSSINRRRKWGLVELRKVVEPVTEIEILARISRKDISPRTFDLKIKEPEDAPKGPEIKTPEVTTPLEPTEIQIPSVDKIDIPAPNINPNVAFENPSTPEVSPSINIPSRNPILPLNLVALKASIKDSIAAPKVEAPDIKPVDFSIDPTGDSLPYKLYQRKDTDGSYKNGFFVRADAGYSANPPAKPHYGYKYANELGITDYKEGWQKYWEYWKAGNWFKKDANGRIKITVTALNNHDYLTLNGVRGDLDLGTDLDVEVTAKNNRGIIVDETSDGRDVFQNENKFDGPTVKFGGTITLKKSENVGIDLQGTHLGEHYNPAYLTVKNYGTIKGEYNSVEKTRRQIGMSFNNADGSHNSTMSRIINGKEGTKTGTITLNSPESAGIQLKPEDPHNWQPKEWQTEDWSKNGIVGERPFSNTGRVLMRAENEGNININGTGSFGILTVFNKGVDKKLFARQNPNEPDTTYKMIGIKDPNDNNKWKWVFADKDDKPIVGTDGKYATDYDKVGDISKLVKLEAKGLLRERLYGSNGKYVRVAPGGEIGRSALQKDKYQSGIFNTGNINISGDGSIGVGLLHEIQRVEIGGNINIGTDDNINQEENSNLTGGDKTKVENTIGVFAGTPTKPVDKDEYDTLYYKSNDKAHKNDGKDITESVKDKTTNTWKKTYVKDKDGNKISTLGSLAGTKTVELNGKITLGKNAKSSIGAWVGDTEQKLDAGKLNGKDETDRRLKRSGDITAKENSIIEVGGENNFGFVVNNSAHSSEFEKSKSDKVSFTKDEYEMYQRYIAGKSTAADKAHASYKEITKIDNLIYKTDKEHHGRGINKGKITVTGSSSVGFAMVKGGNSENTDKGIISVGNTAKKSIAFYGEQDKFTNKGKIEATANTDSGNENTAVYLNGKNDNKIHFINEGDISLKEKTAGSGAKDNVAIYAQGKYHFEHNKGAINVAASGVGLYLKGDKGGIADIASTIKLKDNTSSSTTIGVYSDGDAKVNFKHGSKLEIGKGGIGLYSANAAKFNNTFTIENKLKTILGENSTLAYLKGDNTKTTNVGDFLNKIDLETDMGKNSNLVYATDGAKAILDKDTTITQGGVESTAVLSANNGSTVEVAKDKELKTNTHTALLANKATASNEGDINSTREKGIGIYAVDSKDSGKGGYNKGKITVNKDESVGMLGKNSTLVNKKVDNTKGGNIVVESKKSIAMLGTEGSKVENQWAIDLENDSINGFEDGLVGIAVNGEGSTGSNSGGINIGAKKKTKYSIGMLAENKATIKNKAGGKITGFGENNVGMYSKGTDITKETATNEGTVDMQNKGSAGMFGQDTTILNKGKVNVVGNSAAMYASDANAINEKTIDVKGENSAGVLEEISEQNIEIEGKNTETGTITVTGDNSAGMYGKEQEQNYASNKDPKLTLTNKGKIDIKSKSSAGMLVENKNGTLKKENMKAINKGEINLAVDKEKNVGMSANNAIAENENKISISSKKSTGMFTQNNGTITNRGNISSTGEENIGMVAKDAGSEAINEGEISLEGKSSLGMVASESGKVLNKKNITTKGEHSLGMYIRENSTGENTADGVISLLEKESVGMYAENNGSADTAKNSGTINLGANGATSKSLIGMYAKAEAGKKAGVKNSGTINVNTKDSVGMYAENGNADVDDVELVNEKEINVNAENSVGIFAKKAKVSKVGKIKLGDSADSSVATYVSEGGTVNTDDADIDLGTKNQKRVAYYVNGAGSSLTGTKIGKISGYGVGVFLEGKSGSVATLNASTPELNYTQDGNTGNGLIGLFLKGETNISAYKKGITVGDTVDKKYAIGVYADKQGTSSTPYEFSNNIKTGKNGVGIFADNDSNLKYNGKMEIGNGTEAGTGIFIAKKRTGSNKVTLGDNAEITLKGDKGVGAIVSEGAEFDGGKATINLLGKGVGVFAKKGSIINIGSWTFKNNGHNAEEVRSEEGQAHITSDKKIKPKITLTHVINGETSVDTGKTVTAEDDGTIKSEENIALMAEGIKNPSMTWKNPNFEAWNDGTIDFTNSKKSTAIYADSARIKNNGTIKMGENSVGIYGIYQAKTRKYDGSPDGFQNKLEVTTTNKSIIELGKGSAGIYLKNAEKLNSEGTIKSSIGSTRNTGIFVQNGQDSEADNNKVLNMINKANINLGNGSVGIYSKGSSSDKNKINNSGNITVGDLIEKQGIEKEAPSIGLYMENTELTSTGNVTVGKRGIAFYGDNSIISVNGGTLNYQNKGMLAYLKNGSKFTYSLGDIVADGSPTLYVENSEAKLDGSGNKVNMTVNKDAIGAYVKGNSKLEGLKEINLAENGTGLVLEETDLTVDAEKIASTAEKVKGIIAKKSNLSNKAKINLSGNGSIGIYSVTDVEKNINNEGSIDIAGENSLGVYLKGKQTFTNSADINVAASKDISKPTIGVYAKEGSSKIVHNSGNINVGEKSVGIYSTSDSDVEINDGKLHVKDQGVGIYKENGKVLFKGELEVANHTAKDDTKPVGVYAVNGTEIEDKAKSITIGEKSYGFVLDNKDSNKTNKYTNTNTGTVTMKSGSTFLYSNGKADITNNRDIASNGADHLTTFYIKNGGTFVNNAKLDFTSGKGNVGIYASGAGTTATNEVNGKIAVGETDFIDLNTGKPYEDKNKITYGMGMVADKGAKIVNKGEITVKSNKSIGMYGDGKGTVVENHGNIFLSGRDATKANPINNMTGVYVNNGATFRNYGNIRTIDSYALKDGKIKDTVNGMVGVAALNGSTFENHGNIDIDTANSNGVTIRDSVIKNYGNFRIRVRGQGSTAVTYRGITYDSIKELEDAVKAGKITSDPKGNELRPVGNTDKELEGVKITIKDGKPIFTRNGREVTAEEVTKLFGKAKSNLGMSNIGFYMDTLGRTKPIDIDGATPPVNSQLIVGTEYSERTNSKQWFVKDEVLKPFLDKLQNGTYKLKSFAGSLTWMATPVLDKNDNIKGIAMAKIPYTSFVEKKSNAYNFTDGLEQRYDKNALDSAEKRIFNLLNGIGKKEEVLLAQAFDEMMGHQYANVQQRINATGEILSQEFDYLRSEWQTVSKDSNKVKVFGTNGEYKTDTAGVIDYKNYAYGVAYVHEDETVRLGKTLGWYTGIVHNTFKFKDIGRSSEQMLQTKLGIFKSTPLGYNNTLNWTISGEVFAGYNKMHRRFLVVKEIFHAKSNYYSYGAGIKNEISGNFRLSEDFSLKPYASIKTEYGRMSKIKENRGEVKLEVKSNDYISVRPEFGAELVYKHLFARKTLAVGLAVAYENELGRVANGKNKARVANTTADWFNIRGEKEDRRGNIKTDLNIGLDNQRYGVTANVGYDTKGHNVRGGLGLRVIF